MTTWRRRRFRLLHALASKPGRVYPRGRSVSWITTDDHHICERNMDVHVAALRRTLGEAARMLVTVRGVGHEFED